MKQSRMIWGVLLLWLLTAAAGCSITPDNDTAEQLRPLLNSERIQLKFGSYGIDVLESGSEIRVSNLYSLDDDQKITRTFAVVQYPATVDPRFAQEHQVILNGGSIGAVFKRNGWSVIKRHLYFGEVEESTDYAGIYRLMGNIDPIELAVHVYELAVRKNDTQLSYARIAEVHHPAYLAFDELRRIYPQLFDELLVKSGSTDGFLETITHKMKRQVSGRLHSNPSN